MWRSEAVPWELKPYITELRKAHAQHRGFENPDTRRIGEDIYARFGHEGMVIACDAIRAQLGAEARSLEYEWSGIGEWLG